jgi:GNAT superfamily N-acetyltransferase
MSTALDVRRITAADLVWCEAIDRRAAPAGSAWRLEDFRAFFAAPCHGGFAALWQGSIVGFLLYQADRENRRLYVIRLRVAPGWQRRNAATRLLQHLRHWLSPLPDIPVWVLVNERDLPMQCLLRANGFQAICIYPGRCDDGDSDGYLFELPATLAACGIAEGHR